jgi:hypothetical protein
MKRAAGKSGKKRTSNAEGASSSRQVSRPLTRTSSTPKNKVAAEIGRWGFSFSRATTILILHPTFLRMGALIPSAHRDRLYAGVRDSMAWHFAEIGEAFHGRGGL